MKIFIFSTNFHSFIQLFASIKQNVLQIKDLICILFKLLSLLMKISTINFFLCFMNSIIGHFKKEKMITLQYKECKFYPSKVSCEKSIFYTKASLKNFL